VTKILLFGKGGQVGWALQRSLAPLGKVVALGRSGWGGLCGDFNDPVGLARTVSTVRPEVIVNAAAYTQVDRAEREPELAHRVNAIAVGALARAGHRVDALMVHYSTDFVFDGSGARPWTEKDATEPLNVYGRTKLAGEQLLRVEGPRHLILRTSWLYSAHGRNFITAMLRLAAERDRLDIVDDQVGAPTSADLLADATAHAIVSALADTKKCGTYHVAASGEASRHACARFVVAQGHLAAAALRALPQHVIGMTTDALKAPARRPLNSRLDTSSFCRTFGLYMPPWQLGVSRVLQEILRKPIP
jgi:dTDP-4-dehydrorhamnose reductase